MDVEKKTKFTDFTIEDKEKLEFSLKTRNGIHAIRTRWDHKKVVCKMSLCSYFLKVKQNW